MRDGCLELKLASDGVLDVGRPQPSGTISVASCRTAKYPKAPSP